MGNPETGGYEPDNEDNKREPAGSEQKKSKIYVVANERPDGSSDFLEMEDPGGKMVEGFIRHTEEENKKFAETVKIPEEVEPGSAEMARYEMRKTLKTNMRNAENVRKQGNPDYNLERLIKKQEMEFTVFNSAATSFSRDLIKDGLSTGQNITAEEADKRFLELSASEMFDIVQKYNTEYYWSQKDKGEVETKSSELDDSIISKRHSIDDLLEAASKLQEKLLKEASREKKE